MNDSRFLPPTGLLSSAQLGELDALCQPIDADAPCGPPIRFDPIFTEIRLAREEDDPNLPMGVWERPLKRADWAQIEARCKTTLMHHSKDLQIAAWLAEAWTRQHGFDGLFRGLVLVERLLVRFWDTLHPRLDDDGDAELRVAPLEWMNASLASTLRVQIPVLRDLAPASRFTLADWERLTSDELSPARQEEARKAIAAGGEAQLTRADLIASAMAGLGAEVGRSTRLVRGCLEALSSISGFTDDRLGMEAPNMSRLRDTLRAMERVLQQMAPAAGGDTMEQQDETAAPDAQPGSVAAAAPAPVKAGWRNRDEAYAALEAIADYLNRIEPHSPTPYLLRRAVNWGRMPLPELMAEIIREEGDLNRLGHLLGLNG
ncbi:type VI secretion system protein TssA [Massilia forsythiae]|uniref:Type VI secretion system protein TssA n=1 Tax=Massilia forsythiae TaxID=2728020 RepID=A0A7Z2VYP7_9BURK|nr:type VI secretion system protein TssA [Massilia forsythiae]QJE01574.1 type VI secretion system protein TssA [Massilia forsythiae]